MAPDESGKTTGDPLRDAIAASSKGASSALEQLRQHLTKRERELLEAKLSAENAWNNRPTEQEFNDDWVTPLEALDVSHHRLADDADKWTIIQELQAGTYRAVARRAQTDPNVLGAEHLVVIHPMAWRRMDTNAEHFFWKTNNLVVSAGRNDIYNHPTGDKERYFDIKFDPASFTGRPLPTPPETTSRDLAAKLEAAEAGWDALADQLNNPPPQYKETPKEPQRKGGRPAGKYGEPIARLTLRLSKLSVGELAKFTQDSLGRDLIEEFKKLGLDPPSLDNATRDAAGILRAVRSAV